MEPSTHTVKLHPNPKQLKLSFQSDDAEQITETSHNNEETMKEAHKIKSQNSCESEKYKIIKNIDEQEMAVCFTNIIIKYPNDEPEPTHSTHINKESKSLLRETEKIRPQYYDYGKINVQESHIFEICDSNEKVKSIMNDKFIASYTTEDETETTGQNYSKDVIPELDKKDMSIFKNIIKPAVKLRDNIVGDLFGQEKVICNDDTRDKVKSTLHSEIGDFNNTPMHQQYQAYSMIVRQNHKVWNNSKHRRGERTIVPTKFKDAPIKAVEKPEKKEVVPHTSKVLFTYAPGRGRYMIQQILIVAYILFILTGLTLAVIYHNLTSTFNTIAGWSLPVLLPVTVILIIFIDLTMESSVIMRSIVPGFALSIVAVLLNALLYSSLGVNRQTRVFYIGFIDLSFTMFSIFSLSFYRYRYNKVRMFIDIFLIMLVICSCSVALDMAIATVEMELVEIIALYIFTTGYIMFTTGEIFLIATENMQVYKDDFIYAGFIVYIGFIDLTVKAFCYLINVLLPKRK